MSKITNRVISSMLVIVMILSIIAPTITYGAETGTPELTVIADKTEINRGDTVVVAVKLNTNSNTNISSLQIILKYDADNFSVSKVKRGIRILTQDEEDEGTEAQTYMMNKDIAGRVDVAYSVTRNFDFNANVFEVTFVAKDDAKVGKTSFTIDTDTETYPIQDSKNNKPVNAEISNATINIVVPEEKCLHTNKTEVAKKDATCLNTGNNKYYVCSDCQKILKADGETETTIEEETIKALEHDYSLNKNDETNHWKECSRCGEKIEEEEHSSADDKWYNDDNNKNHYKICGCGIKIYIEEHTAEEFVKENEIESTCKKEGSFDEVTYCTVCNAEISRDHKTIDKLEHTKGETQQENVVPATHQAKGSYDEVIYCSVCGEEISRVSKELDKIPHDGSNSEWDSDENEHWKICGCGVKIEIGEHEGKEPVKENKKASTCSKNGSYDEVIYCKVCNKELSREHKITDKIEHTQGNVVKENVVSATCENDGSYDEVVYCTVCNEELSRTSKKENKLGHKESEIVKENEIKSTCKKEGSYDEVTYCTVCNKELSRVHKITEKLDHNSGEIQRENIISATHSSAGSYDEVIYCKDCGTELSRESKIIDMIPHDGSESAWYGDESSHWKICGCGVKIEIADHEQGEKVKENVNPATCTKDGSYDEVVYCKVCKKELSRETKTELKLGHKEGNTVKENIVNATCEKDGSYDDVAYCENCNEELSRIAKVENKKEHIAGETIKENEVEATVNKDGSYDEVTYCKNCETELSRVSKTTPKFVYEFLVAEEEHENGTDGTLTFKVNGDFNKFIGIKIDGVLVDKSNYFARTGSTIVTLNSDYLNNLSLGSHKITFVYDDSEIETDFKIVEKVSNTDNTSTDTPNSSQANTSKDNSTEKNVTKLESVNTGDESNMILWIGGLIISGILFVIVLKCTKKS